MTDYLFPSARNVSFPLRFCKDFGDNSLLTVPLSAVEKNILEFLLFMGVN